MINCIYSNEKEQCLHKDGIKRFFTGQCGMSWKKPCPVQEMIKTEIEESAASTQLCPSVWQDTMMSFFEKAETKSSLNTCSPNLFEGGLSGGGGASRSWDDISEERKQEESFSSDTNNSSSDDNSSSSSD